MSVSATGPGVSEFVGFGAARSASPGAGAADGGLRGAFDAAIRGATGRAASAAEPEGARASAEAFVASALLLPLLNEARSGALKSDLFGGGFAHDAIAQQLETHLADAVVRGANFPVVDRIVADAARGEGA